MPAPHRPTILLPDVAQRPSGLWIPRGGSDADDAGAASFSLSTATGGMSVVSRQQPNLMDVLFRAVPVEADLNLETSTLADLRARVTQLPFDTAVLLYARLAAHAWHIGTDTKKQLALVREIFPATAGAIPAIERFFNKHGRGAFFIEQQLFGLLRLVLEHARQGAVEENDDEALQAFSTLARRALFAALTVVTESINELPGGEHDREKWLAVLIQNGGYNAKTPPLNAFTRAHRLLELSRDDSVGEPQDRCDITQWLTAEYGLSLDEQFAVGFAFGALVGAFDEERPSSEISLLPHARLDPVLDQLGILDRKMPCWTSSARPASGMPTVSRQRSPPPWTSLGGERPLSSGRFSVGGPAISSCCRPARF
jgi:hypothetical protein